MNGFIVRDDLLIMAYGNGLIKSCCFSAIDSIKTDVKINKSLLPSFLGGKNKYLYSIALYDKNGKHLIGVQQEHTEGHRSEGKQWLKETYEALLNKTRILITNSPRC